MKLTKGQMVREMMDGLKFIDNEKVIINRCKAPKSKIEQVYNFYLTHEQTRENKLFCINLLVVF